MKKRAVSGVVATVMIVLIVVILVTIVWQIFIPMIDRLAAEATRDRIPLSIDTSKGYTVWDNQANIARIQVRYGEGDEKLEKIKIIFTVYGVSLDPTILPPPQANQVVVYDIDLSQYSRPEKVEIVPIILVNGREVELDSISGAELAEGYTGQSYDLAKIYEIDQDYTGQNPGKGNLYLEDLVAYYPLTYDYGNWAQMVDGGPIEEGDIEGTDATVDPGYLTLDGDDYVEIPNENLVYGDNNRTVCIWAKPHELGNQDAWAFAYGQPGGARALFIGREGNPSQTSLLIGGFSSTNTLKKTGFWELNVWKNVCITYNGSAVEIYLNGISESLDDVTGDWSTDESFAYFGRSKNNEHFWDGDLAQFTMYNRTLSAEEILGLHDFQVATGRYD